MSKYTLELKHHFEAAHSLKDTEFLITKKCIRKHGHYFEVVVKIVANVLRGNMVVDFGKIKQIIDFLDHKDLNTLLTKDNEPLFNNPTAENIARYLYEKVKEEVLGEVEVTVFESPNAFMTYSDD